jgi:hypothetical protein
MSLAITSAPVRRLNSVDLPGVGVAHQRHDRIGHLGPRRPVQAARLHDLGQLPPEPRDRLVDGAPVGLDLRLAGAAHEAEAAALAFKVGPGAHQPRALVAERGKLHLQHTFAGARAVGKDLQDQAGAVQKLAAPGLFEVALLHRRHRTVDQDKADPVGFDPGLQLVDLARPEQHARLRARQAHDVGRHDLQVGERRGQRHAFLQRGAGVSAATVGLDVGMQDHGAHRRTIVLSVLSPAVTLRRRYASPPSLFPVVKIDRLGRHDRRDRMLVDQLALPIPAQEHAEIVEPGDHALQFHAVDQKDRHRHLSSSGRD